MIPGIVAGRRRLDGGGGPADPYNDLVVALLHFDGVDGSTTFTDEVGGIWTPTGSGIEIDTAQKQFGTASLISPSTTGTYITAADSYRYGFQQFDYTVELWARITALSTLSVFYDPRTTLAQNRAVIYVAGDQSIRLFVGGGDRIISSAGVIQLNTWYHVALARQGSSTKLFVDGVQVGSTFTDNTDYDSYHGIIIGALGDNLNNPAKLIGNLDELRVTSGVARYTANFTPPSAAFTYESPTWTEDKWSTTNAGPQLTFSENDRTIVRNIGGNDGVDNGSASTRSRSTGKRYVEFRCFNDGTWSGWAGMVPAATDMTSISNNEGPQSTGYYIAPSLGGGGGMRIERAGTTDLNVLTAQPSGMTLGLAIDFAAGKGWFRINAANDWLSAANTLIAFDESTPSFTFTPSSSWRLYGSSPFTSTHVRMNQGPAFRFAAPSGFGYW